MTGDTCGNQSCLACAPAAAMKTGWALWRAKPDWYALITGTGDGFRDIQRVMNNLTKLARRKGHAWDCGWVAEPNPGGGGSHVHAYVRGPDPSSVLAEASGRWGAGRMTVQRRRRDKGPLSYPFKLLEETAHLPEEAALVMFNAFWSVNGNRMVKATQGFWLDDEGLPCGAKAARRGGQHGRYVRVDRVPIDHLKPYLRGRGFVP